METKPTENNEQPESEKTPEQKIADLQTQVDDLETRLAALEDAKRRGPRF